MVQRATLPPLTRGVWYPMTWEEFIAWDVEGKTEWVDGEGIAYVSNSARHIQAVKLLGTLIDLFARIHDLGEAFTDSMLMRLSSRPSGRMPDVLVIGRADANRLREQWFDGPALLVVEVVSEESAGRDLVEKRAEYERAGIAEYLIVEARPGRSGLTYLRLDMSGRYQSVEPDADGRVHSEALPGFWFDPAWLELDPPPSVERLMRRIAPGAYRAYMERVFAGDAS